MKKKLLALILAAALCLGLAAPALALEYGEEYRGYTTAASQQYRDVTDDHWAKASIETCSQRTWFNGYPDGTFRPEGLITREEAAKVFAVAMGLEIETNPAVTYTDTEGNWASAYIEATKPLFPNVANLQGTSSFRPKQTITREETIYALVIAWGYGSKAKNADLSILNMFSDTSSISAGVKPYMAVGVSEGLVSGLPDGTIAAQKGLTRAEFATLLARALSHGYGDTKQEFQAPAITLDKYPAATTETQVSVTGTVTPADASLKLDGKSIKAGKDGSFTLALELETGKNTFTLTAENAYGTRDSKTITVERTEEAVTIRILSDVPETTQAATLAVNGKVENWSDACTLLLDNTRVSVDKDGYFQLTLQLEEGRNAFALAVARGQKEVGAATIQVTRTAPEPEATTTPSEKPSADPAEGSSSQGDTSKSSDVPNGYIFIRSNDCELDPGLAGIYQVSIVDADGLPATMRVTANLANKIRGDYMDLSAPRKYVGHYFAIGEIDKNGVVSALSNGDSNPVERAVPLDELLSIGGGSIVLSTGRYTYDDETKFVYVDMGWTDGVQVNNKPNVREEDLDDIDFKASGAFLPNGFFTRLDVDAATSIKGIYRAVDAAVICRPNSNIADYVYVLRDLW